MMALIEEVIGLFREGALEIAKLQLGELHAGSLLSELGIDSVDTVEILAFIESRLGVRFRDDEMLGILTVGDLARVVERARSR